MQKLLLTLTTIVLASNGLLASEPITEAEKKAGWRLLFDGQSTDGWRNYKKDSVSDGWQIRDGALVRASQGAGDIVTTEQFGEFELCLQYRISAGGNSGIMFHVTEEYDRPWQSGPEIQIQDNVDGHDPQKSGWLYQLYPARQDATRPAGEWNELYIRITGGESEIYMNGIRYARFQIGSEDWDQRVAKSKFSKFEGFGKAAKGHICLQDHGNEVAFRNIKVRELTPQKGVQNPVDGKLPLRPEVAFAKLKWTRWSPVDDAGRPRPLRPIVLTHAGDGSNRVFVATQHGVIHVFENTDDAQATKVFLDHRQHVVYKDRENEEGFLGLAFHPNYKENGEFFAYYTTADAPHTSVISRFRVSKDNPNRADPDFEEEILRIPQPFWNHNGGTIAFGPDGYLYVGLGDGGAANDPNKNGQNLETLLGTILRIDVDRREGDLAYAIPPDNPFAERKNARGEIWAYGLRNVWRLAFDPATKMLWAGDVGQNLWEEIDIIERGGNYGWNHREATHIFGDTKSEPNEKLIEPIWEYDHQVGKSITGGPVYRGQKLPELQGAYIYADYVSGKIWALRYDTNAKRVVSNLEIPGEPRPVISFGEDETGEIYFLVVATDGKGVFRFVKTD